VEHANEFKTMPPLTTRTYPNSCTQLWIQRAHKVGLSFLGRRIYRRLVIGAASEKVSSVQRPTGLSLHQFGVTLDSQPLGWY